MKVGKFIIAAGLVWASSFGFVVSADNDRGQGLDAKLARVLREHRFSGRVGFELEERLGRRQPGTPAVLRHRAFAAP
jgi:hypothetical protein